MVFNLNNVFISLLGLHNKEPKNNYLIYVFEFQNTKFNIFKIKKIIPIIYSRNI